PQLKHRSWLREVQNHLMLPPAAIADQKVDGGVTKVIFRLSDGHHIETVIVPMDRYATVCVSSQVGCRMGCRFCETAAIGFRRNLSASEIVYQVFAARHHLEVPVKNIVFMGMGEPLDNVDAVIKAIDVVKDQRGLNIAERNITLSTSGRIDGIQYLAGIRRPHIRIAVSLNAPNDDVRSKLMPINRRYPMAPLKDALLGYPLKPDNHIVIEYVLIDGVNDLACHADELADYLSGLPVKVNLIPCNPGPASPYQPPPAEAIESFRKRLVANRLFVRMRRTKGRALMAACGQLGRGFGSGTGRPSI
ncbi:MAG: 23S rRNA (adenine(2503)-C(2))-methyltransferase RlmN, partial [Desulfobacterales bacterium]